MDSLLNLTEDMIAKDCGSVEEFLAKYYKPERYTAQGPEYMAAVIAQHEKMVEKYGYTGLSHHDNITGHLIYFIGISAKKEG